MAIERVWQTGWELNDVLSEISNRSSSNRITTQNTFPKTGIYSLRIGDSTTWPAMYATLTPPFGMNQLRLGFHARFPITVYTNKGLVYFLDASNNALFSLKTNSTSNGVGLYNLSGTQIGNNFPLNPDTYYFFGFDIKKDNSSGWIYFYIDGNLAVNFDGNTSGTAISSIRFGQIEGTTGAGYVYYDDMYLDNTSGEASPVPIPDERFYYKGLSGDGTYLEFSTYTGSTHYTLLDEIPPSGNDYVYSSTPGQRDSYQFSDFALTSGETIEALIPLAIARKESAANILLGLGAGLSGTFSIGNFQSMPTSYGISFSQRLATNPFGADWSENDINNAQLYIMSSGTYT